jgi:tetraacyldisaccharide 4'-kinase
MLIRWKRGRWREELPGTPLRWLLLPGWCVFRPLTALRNLLYDLGWLPALRLNVPVISVGNLAAGGTGKTPVTRAIASALIARDRTPAVLMRGYRSDGADNDEARTVAECPVVCDADRVAGGHRAIATGADCLILDDGFQHRRLHRDLDVVLIDATRPFSGVLPLGYEREGRAGLARASVIVVTRGELIDPMALADLCAQLSRWNKPVVRLEEERTWLTDLAGQNEQNTSTLAGQPVLLASGLGNPRGFEAAARRLGWQVIASWRYPDHHHFDARDATELSEAARRAHATLVVTGKDAVKLAVLLPAAGALVLHQRVVVAAADRPCMDRLLDQVLSPR